MAGDYQKAVDLLSTAVQQRPQNPSLRSELAWAQVEVRRYADALQTTQQVPGVSPMANPVVLWLSQEREQGLRGFEGAVRSQPEWGNPAWVKALYSPTVAQSVREMQGRTGTARVEGQDFVSALTRVRTAADEYGSGTEKNVASAPRGGATLIRRFECDHPNGTAKIA